MPLALTDVKCDFARHAQRHGGTLNIFARLLFDRIQLPALPITLSSLALRVGPCPICGPSLFVRLADNEIAVRCLRCRSTPITLSLVSVLRSLVPILQNKKIFELSSRGALVRFLRKEKAVLTLSEFFPDTPAGSFSNGVQCQDIQSLTYESESFDICTSTEVFEHVPDDHRGFGEIARVLNPGGLLVFTVPLSSERDTVERAALTRGRIIHLLEPEYHGDRIRGDGKVLCFRNYGTDIVERLLRAGFSSAHLKFPELKGCFGYKRAVIVGQK